MNGATCSAGGNELPIALTITVDEADVLAFIDLFASGLSTSSTVRIAQAVEAALRSAGEVQS